MVSGRISTDDSARQQGDRRPAVTISPADLFPLRHVIARIGETDWLGWWESRLLGDAGQYAAPRLFPRTAKLSSVHLAILAAKTRHDALMPKEPRIHLFDLGELYEARFERWIVEKKVEGWEPEELPLKPDEEMRTSATAALEAVGMGDHPAPDTGDSGRRAVALGKLDRSTLANAEALRKALHQLVGAYSLSAPGEFIAPYFSLQAQ